MMDELYEQDWAAVFLCFLETTINTLLQLYSHSHTQAQKHLVKFSKIISVFS